MAYLVIIKGERFSGSYAANTALQAVKKAETVQTPSTVTIVDPEHREWTPEHFDGFLQRWSRSITTESDPAAG